MNRLTMTLGILLFATAVVHSQTVDGFLKVWPNMLRYQFPGTTLLVAPSVVTPSYSKFSGEELLGTADKKVTLFLTLKIGGKTKSFGVQKWPRIQYSYLNSDSGDLFDARYLRGTIICIPGNGFIYVVRQYEGIPNGFFYTRKYDLSSDKIDSVPQPLLLINSPTTTRDELPLFSDVELTNKMGTVLAGSEIFVVGILDSGNDTFPSDSSNPSHGNQKTLVRTSTGLVGWVLDERYDDPHPENRVVAFTLNHLKFFDEVAGD